MIAFFARVSKSFRSPLFPLPTLLAFFAVAALPLAAQQAYPPCRLWAPEASFPASGFAVKGRLQSPLFGITAGVVPGPMPVPVQLHIDGSSKSWARVGYYSQFVPDPPPGDKPPKNFEKLVDPILDDPGGHWEWVAEGQEVFRPVYGAIHFGYATAQSTYGPVVELPVIVLENRTVLDGLTPLAQMPQPNTFKYFSNFGLSVPSTSISLSSDAGHATWLAASLASIGPIFQSIVQSYAQPAGFSTSPYYNTYRVVADQGKARVFQYFNELGAYVPLVWRDRQGNLVAFKWERKTTGLPAGATAIIRLTVTSVPAKSSAPPLKGVQVEWAYYQNGTVEKELARIDFINVNAPSMHITGYPGISSQLPAPMTAALAPNYSLGIGQMMPISPKTGGPIGRPTQVRLSGNRSELPAWTYYSGSAPAQPGGPKSNTRTWSLTYGNQDKNRIDSFTEPSGLVTTFTYDQGSTDWPYGPIYRSSSNDCYGSNYPIRSMRVAEAKSSNAGLTAKQSWTWSQASGLVTREDSFNNATLTTKTYYDMAAPRDIANGVWRKIETYSESALIATAENIETAAAGADGTLTLPTKQEFWQEGQPAYTIVVAPDAGRRNLRPTSVEIKYNGGSKTASKTEYGYGPADWGGLDPGNLTSTTTKNYDANGAFVLAPHLVKINQWDPQQERLSKAYAYGSSDPNLKQGILYSDYSTTPVNLPSSIKPYVENAGTATYGPAQSYDYDILGRLTKATLAGGGAAYVSQTFAFDDNDRPTTTTDQLGAAATAMYDDRGRPVAQSYASMVTSFTYPNELTVEATDRPIGQSAAAISTQEFDAFGRILSVSTAIGPDTSTVMYSYNGRTTTAATVHNSVALPTETYTADALGRPTYRLFADGTSEAYAYAADSTTGTHKVTISRTSGSVTLVASETRNLLGQVTASEAPHSLGTTATDTSTYTYDGMGNLLQHDRTTSSGSQRRLFTYDSLGRLTSRTEPETGTTLFGGYTGPHGRPGAITEPLGNGASRVRAISYDPFGRITSVASGNDGLSYTYDTTKPLLTGTSRTQAAGTATQNYAYDQYGRVTAEKTTTGWDGFIANVQFFYDAWGDIAMVTYPGATSNTAGRAISYEYGADRRLAAVKSGGATLASFTYDPLGRARDTIFASGASNTYTYSPITRISKWEVKPLGSAQTTNNFTYDSYGYLSGTGEWSIANDALGRITSATGHGIATTHGHDAFGNNTSHQAAPTPSTMINWAFPAMASNRVPTQTSTGAQAWWQYADNGEAVWVGKAPGGDKIQLAWDSLGLLKAVSDTATSSAHQFAYAPSGLRVRDQRTGASPHDKRYVYTTTGALMTAYTSSNTRTDIIYANGRAIAEIDQSNNIYELHSDHLGSPRYITNGNTSQSTKGQVIGEQAFGPYGESLRGTFNGKALPSGYWPITGYTGHLNEDMTGLIYMKGRYYSPLWHRFVSSDQGLDPNSLNQYAYAGGRPFMAADPSGMSWVLRSHWVSATQVEVLDGRGNVMDSSYTDGHWAYYLKWVDDRPDRPSGSGDPGGGGGKGGVGDGAASQAAISNRDPLCDKLEKLGITNGNFERMKSDMQKTIQNQLQPPGFGTIYREFGHSYFSNKYYNTTPKLDSLLTGFGNGWGTSLAYTKQNIQVPLNKRSKGYTFHTHPNMPGFVLFDGTQFILYPSLDDSVFAFNNPNLQHFLGTSESLMLYNFLGSISTLSGPGWWDINCGNK